MKPVSHTIIRLALIVCLLCLLSGTALAADEAADLTAKCKFSTSVNSKKLRNMHNNNYQNYWEDEGKPGGDIQVKCPKGKPAQGVMLTLFKCNPVLRFEDAEGHLLAEYDKPYATNWIAFSKPAETFVIRRTEGESLRISNIHVLGTGELPNWVQRWEPLEGDADLMLVSTHPDDEILWFGGLLPTYAGERGLKVMVVYMVGGLNGMRTAELLEGLWTMGVRQYPDIGDLPDKTGSSLVSAVAAWGGEDVAPTRVTAALRRYRPKVVVTQDINGEYGHFHHVITVQAVIDAVTRYGLDPAYDPASVEAYGVYAPQKLYLHLWKEGQIQFNWREPLSAFNGRTGLEVARSAFKKHVSQQNSRHKYQVLDRGRQDSRLFGLYYSNVGPDEALNDLFEHISLDMTSDEDDC